MVNSTELSYGRYQFVETRPWLAITCICIISLASVIGSFGNGLILSVLTRCRGLRRTDAIFIGNLAISDMYVTLIADPMSILAKLEGEDFFRLYPWFCKLIGCLCTVSCVNSLLTIGGMAVNRYFHICNNSAYRSLFTQRNVLLMCCSFWVVGGILVLMNLAGVGDHSFDRKSLECIWDRMASRSFTVVFSVVMVWIPLLSISFSYVRIYIYVVRSRKRIHVATVESLSNNGNNFSVKKALPPLMKKKISQEALRLAKTLFVIYAVFTICWLPYALLLVVDWYDEFSHELHLIVTMTAHLHPSLTFIVYYLTHQKFKRAFQDVFRKCFHRENPSSGFTNTRSGTSKSDQ